MPPTGHQEKQCLTDPREPADCSVCGAAPPPHVVFWSQDFPVVRCPGCGVLRVSPRLTPEALRAYYGPAYWASQDSVVRGYFDYAGDAENIRRTFKRRWQRIIRGVSQPGKMLDVGCASGFLLGVAQAGGWNVTGLEWSEHAKAQAPALIGKRIRLGTLPDAGLQPASLDVITFWDFLEHSGDPRKDLEQAARLLKPGGRLSVIIPDAGSLLARFMGPRWEEFKKPQEHLYFFTGAQLQRLVISLGFEIIATKREGKYASLGFAFSRFKPGDGLWYLLARAAGRLIRILGWERKVVYINPGDKLHFICRRRGA